MGFNEYDRIRCKNSIYNYAYEEFTHHKKMGVENRLIAKMYESQKKFILQKRESHDFRLKIIEAIIYLAKNCDENFKY